MGISVRNLRANLAKKPLLDHPDAFDLAFGWKSLVETFIAEFIFQLGPRCNEFLKNSRIWIVAPLLDQVLAKCEIRKNANQCLKRNAACELVLIVHTPNFLHHGTHG